MKTQLKEKEDLLAKLRQESEEQQTQIKKMKNSIQSNERQIEEQLEMASHKRVIIEEQEKIITIFKYQLDEITSLKEKRKDQEIQAVEEEKEEVRLETEVEQVDLEEFNVVNQMRKDNKKQIVKWYQDFEIENNRKPELFDLEAIQDLALDYQDLRARYTHMKSLLLEQGILTPDVSKFKPKVVESIGTQAEHPVSDLIIVDGEVEQELIEIKKPQTPPPLAKVE